MIKPHPEIDWCDAEDAKIRELHAAGWELYDSTEQLSQSIASMGNMLRNISGIIGDPKDVYQLKADLNDQRLILYLESLEDRMESGREALAALESMFRELRCELVQVSYKMRIPARESGSEGGVHE